MMHALLSDQGTAMAETGLCDEHFTPSFKFLTISGAIEEIPDWDGGDFHEVRNPEVPCQICGKTEEDE